MVENNIKNDLPEKIKEEKNGTNDTLNHNKTGEIEKNSKKDPPEEKNVENVEANPILSKEETVPTEDKVDSSAEVTEAISSPQNKDRVEGDDKQVSSSVLQLDEKSKTLVRDLLQEDLKNAVQDVKKDFMVIFGLFASFVIFISVNIQLFKNTNNTFELIGLISLSLSFIIFFALIINGITKGKTEWKDLLSPPFIVNIFFLTMGIFFLFISSSKNTETIKQLELNAQADSNRINSFQTELINIKSKISQTDSTILNLKSILKSNQVPYTTNKAQK